MLVNFVVIDRNNVALRGYHGRDLKTPGSNVSFKDTVNYCILNCLDQIARESLPCSTYLHHSQSLRSTLDVLIVLAPILRPCSENRSRKTRVQGDAQAFSDLFATWPANCTG